ncbi:MAG: hypothetical protein AAB408_00465 [Patescibacteria group bacterium]
MTKITICSSASFYQDVIDIEEKLKQAGFAVEIPSTANRMKASNDFVVEHYKTWFGNPEDYVIKKQLMDEHFAKVVGADAILVVNQTKKGIPGYIGGNTLMEMTVAYINHKPIYLWNDIDSTHPFEEEIKGLGSIVIDEDVTKIN